MTKLRTATQLVNERIDEFEAGGAMSFLILILPPWVAANLAIEVAIDLHQEIAPVATYRGYTVRVAGSDQEFEQCLELALAYTKVRHIIENGKKVEVK